MIDFHTHVLPHLDDGAKDKETALKMLSELQKQGVDEVVCTPHYYGKKRGVDQFIEQRMYVFSSIREEIPDGLTIKLGAEVHISGVNDPSDEALCALAVEGTKCVLLELPFEKKLPTGMLTWIERFTLSTGYTPIIAHAERYSYFSKQPQLLTELVRMGCLVQLNAEAFYERRTRAFAFALLKHGLVHCLGTDAHDTANRAPNYLMAKNVIFAKGLRAEWERTQRLMQNLLRGKNVVVSFTPVKKIFGIYF